MTNADAATDVHTRSSMFSEGDIGALGLDRFGDSSGQTIDLVVTATQSADYVFQPADETVERGPVADPTTSMDRRRAGDPLGGQSAVLLAKTQASAALVQSGAFRQRLRDVERQLTDERDQTDRATEELAALRRELEAARSERLASQAVCDELRHYLNQQQHHLGFLRDRILSIESERDLQLSCMGWFGRRRFQRLLQRRWGSNPRAVLMSEQQNRSSNEGNLLAADQQGHNRAMPQA